MQQTTQIRAASIGSVSLQFGRPLGKAGARAPEAAAAGQVEGARYGNQDGGQESVDVQQGVLHQRQVGGSGSEVGPAVLAHVGDPEGRLVSRQQGLVT